ncbi:hypothetical protein LX97_01519 [Nonlabens dokdonensis]|uniref:Uncharacterized protein n=1 Tax=Nonlabens dokdonensis TaxID=328515 RepID=A0ABX5PXY3_9FLAO|nr:hypothetical protein LX97_01519 [Nonlabens dokdonensis]
MYYYKKGSVLNVQILFCLAQKILNSYPDSIYLRLASGSNSEIK